MVSIVIDYIYSEIIFVNKIEFSFLESFFKHHFYINNKKYTYTFSNEKYCCIYDNTYYIFLNDSSDNAIKCLIKTKDFNSYISYNIPFCFEFIDMIGIAYYKNYMLFLSS